jgi:spore germination protein YaaH
VNNLIKTGNTITMHNYIKLIYLTLIIIVFGSQLLAQNPKSIHQGEWEKHKNYPTHKSLIGYTSEEIIDLQNKKSQLNATVFGYLPYWATSDFLQYSLLTHIAAFGVNINSDGTLGNDHSWPWTALINEAHANGVKVILTAILFSGNDIHTLITTPAYKNTFFLNIKNKILEGNADGVNIDFESLNNADKGTNIVTFMHDLTTYLHNEIPGSEVSYAGPAVNWSGYWDLVGLANACDYIFIMGYAFAGSWNSNSGPMAPLTGGSINITNTVNTQYGTITQNNPHKLILGLPYYGYEWITSGGQARASVISGEGSTFYHEYQSGANTYGEIWDAQSQSPWYKYYDGDDWHQVWCDNDSSLGLKYDLAQSNNLKGVGMWALGYDEERMELWHELYSQFGGTELLAPNKPEKFRVEIENSTILKVRYSEPAFANDYNLYMGHDGISFPNLYYVHYNNIFFHNLNSDSIYYYKVQALNDSAISQATEVLAGIPAANQNEILIVQGFDRNSTGNELKNYIRQHAEAFNKQNKSFSSCSNEAIISGKILLNNYAIVDWILGEESSIDETFNFTEQEKIKTYLQQGGKLLISGSEIGWDLSNLGATADQQFYADYLKTEYIDDAPLGQSSTYYDVEGKNAEIFDGIPNFSFDDGTHGTYNVDWPDAINAINGGKNCLLYSGISENDGVAATYFDGFFPSATSPGKLMYMAFPFETVYPESARDTLMSRIIQFFEMPPATIDEEEILPGKFVLFQNYPNPFNSSTKIRFQVPEAGNVNIIIYDILGKQILKSENQYLVNGDHEFEWNGRNQNGISVNSGTYFVRLYFTSSNKIVYSDIKKMIYLK